MRKHNTSRAPYNLPAHITPNIMCETLWGHIYRSVKNLVIRSPLGSLICALNQVNFVSTNIDFHLMIASWHPRSPIKVWHSWLFESRSRGDRLQVTYFVPESFKAVGCTSGRQPHKLSGYPYKHPTAVLSPCHESTAYFAYSSRVAYAPKPLPSPFCGPSRLVFLV